MRNAGNISQKQEAQLRLMVHTRSLSRTPSRIRLIQSSIAFWKWNQSSFDFYNSVFLLPLHLRLNVVLKKATARKLLIVCESTTYTLRIIFCYLSRILSANNERVLSFRGHTMTVHHFAYLVWPDHTAPFSPAPMVGCLKLCRQLAGSQPITVHCSAGIGRSATFIGNVQLTSLEIVQTLF